MGFVKEIESSKIKQINTVECRFADEGRKRFYEGKTGEATRHGTPYHARRGQAKASPAELLGYNLQTRVFSDFPGRWRGWLFLKKRCKKN